jgi:hypothetical protein
METATGISGRQLLHPSSRDCASKRQPSDNFTATSFNYELTINPLRPSGYYMYHLL